MKHRKAMATLAAIIIITGAAMTRAEEIPLGELREKSATLSQGVVDKIEDSTHFILKNATGTIRVEVPEDQALSPGMHVLVTGDVARDSNGIKIVSTRIQELTPEEVERRDSISKH